jgi:hypothetical protein
MSIAPRPGPRPLDFTAFACASALVVASGALDAQALSAQLIAFDTDGSDSVGFAAPAGPIHAPVTALRLRFDLPVLPELGDFRVIRAGADGVLDTVACGIPPIGDDLALDLLAVATSVDGIVLSLDAPTGLPSGEYRLLVCDSLGGLDGLPFDGDADGLPGGIALRDFAITHDPQLDNPGFTADTARWSVANLSIGSVVAAWDAVDADASATSGALRVTGSLGSFALLRSDTCVPVHESFASGPVPATVRMRYRVLSGSVRFVVTARTGFAGDLGEGPCDGPGQSRSYFVDAGSPSADFQTHESGALSLEALPHGELEIGIVGLGGPFEVLLDDIGFNFASRVVFESSFEGGID